MTYMNIDAQRAERRVSAVSATHIPNAFPFWAAVWPPPLLCSGPAPGSSSDSVTIRGPPHFFGLFYTWPCRIQRTTPAGKGRKYGGGF